MRIIPAIDIIDGKCVRLSKGDYSSVKTYNEDPLEVAQAFEAAGLKYLHLVDLDGARAGRVRQWRVLEKLSANSNMTIDFGGGIRSGDDLRIAFESGAAQVSVGSAAVKRQEEFFQWLELHGSDKIILSADVHHGKISVSGWQESTDLGVIEFLQEYIAGGVQYVACTDISRDGMLSGPSFALYNEILGEVPAIKLIASGGVSNRQDLERLAELSVNGVIIGKAIYEGNVSLKELEELC